MEWDLEKKDHMSKKIKTSIENYLRTAGIADEHIEQTSKEFISAAVRISPPEKERAVIHMITMLPSGRDGGRSTKAGNITLNIRSLFDAIANGAFTVTSITEAPWAIPFAVILLWNSIWRNAQVSLTETEAVTIWAMWQVKDANKYVKLDDIKPSIDAHAIKYQRSTLSAADINHAIINLIKLGSIKPIRGLVNTWWLCEWISPSY